jgi:hypothetical protein
MLSVLVHLVASSLVAVLIELVASRLSGETAASAPLGAVLVGVTCAAAAHHVSPWATPAILALLALARGGELWRERAERKAAGLPPDPR